MKAPSLLRPELELILCCARTQMDPERAHRVRDLLQQGLKWQSLVREAQAHCLTPLLYWHLKTIGPDMCPPAFLELLQGHFRNNTRRNLIRLGELLKLLSLFAWHEIPAVPFKGPVLALTVYRSLALREFGDLDILVYPRDMVRAQDILLSEGYQVQSLLNPRQQAALIRYERERVFWRDEDSTIVEVQCGFTPRYFPFPLDLEHLRDRLVPVTLGGATVLTFRPEDLLLILAVHGAKHCWERLAWICDVAELLEAAPEIDLRQVVDQAGRLGVGRMVLLGLYLAHDLLGTALPQEVWCRIQADPAVPALAGLVRRWVYQGTAGWPGVLGYTWFHLRVREHPQDGIRYLLGLLTTPRPSDWALLPLPAALFPLYYVLRPFLMAAKLYRVTRHRPRNAESLPWSAAER